jgi:ribonuclease D
MIPIATTPATLEEIVSQFAREPSVALDCESNGMHAFHGRLCVLQLATARTDGTPETIALVDPLALDSLVPLTSLLGATGPVKILHDLGFDARILRETGITLGNVIDTSVLARFLSYRETGLASLLARYELKLEKSLQQHNWAQRPMGEREVNYRTPWASRPRSSRRSQRKRY